MKVAFEPKVSEHDCDQFIAFLRNHRRFAKQVSKDHRRLLEGQDDGTYHWESSNSLKWERKYALMEVLLYDLLNLLD